MRARTIGWLLTTVVVVFASALVPGVAAASGGGGCGGPVTEGAGTTVEIEDFCFGPTILRVEPGDPVTFVNRDRAPHTVLGANGLWGSYDALRRGREATYTFVEPGVYPYVCTWHPGMVGSLVVGSGVGGAIETSTVDGPVVRAQLAGGDVVPAEQGAGLWIAVASVVGLIVGAIGSAALTGIRRARRDR